MSPKKYKFTVVGLLNVLKVSKFQNEFIKSSFLPKYESKIVRIFRSYFEKFTDFYLSHKFSICNLTKPLKCETIYLRNFT